MESNSTAILIKIKLRHSLGRPSRSDFVQSDFDRGRHEYDYSNGKNTTSGLASSANYSAFIVGL